MSQPPRVGKVAEEEIGLTNTCAREDQRVRGFD